MALDHPQAVRSLTASSSFARTDPFVRREFELRRKLVAEADMHTVYTCYALFLFSPTYTRQNPDAVTAWIDRVSRITPEREVALKRIEMIMAHDVLARLGEIRTPTLVLGGDHDMCLPPELSDELARGIPGATRVTLPGGHMIHDECPEKYFETVRAFIDEH